MDDDDDANSSDSDGAFADIPLPLFSLQPDNIPLPPSLPPSAALFPLDTIPLPPTSRPSGGDETSSSAAAETTTRKAAGSSGGKDAKTTAAAKKQKDGAVSENDGEAVHAQTSIGVITVHLNRKLAPRVSRASVFDLPDDSAKEVSRKLLRLRKLKRLKSSAKGGKDGVPAGGQDAAGGPEDAAAAGARKRNDVEERIMSWKQELLNDQNQRAARRVAAKVAPRPQKRPSSLPTSRTEIRPEASHFILQLVAM